MSERNQQTRTVNKAEIDRQNAVVAYVHAAEVLHPGNGALDFPALAIAPELAFVLVAAQHAVAAVRSNPVDAPLLHASAQRIAVVAFVGDHAPRLAAGASAAATGHFNRRQYRLRHVMLGG